MTKKQQLYNEHFDEIAGIVSVTELAEEDVDRIIARLLSCLPNKGKLYKYRSIEGQAFDYAFDGLKNGYLWMARASSFNDDFDSTVSFDPMKDLKRQMDSFLSNPWLFLRNWEQANHEILIKYNLLDEKPFETVMSCVDKTTYQIDREKAVRMLIINEEVSQEDAEQYIDDLLKYVEMLVKQNGKELEKPISDLLNFNYNCRDNIFVYAMSEEFDSDTMWAYYANNNNGFCIEYDFNRIKKIPFLTRRFLISIFKIIYKNRIDEYSFVDMQNCFLNGFQDRKQLKKVSKDILEKELTKKSKWKEEKEWRIYLCNLRENKIYADIVSGLIIDKRIIDTDNAKKLIELAKERCWSVKTRRLDAIGTKHLYKEISL